MQFGRNGKRHLIRRLRAVGLELASAREELAVVQEQYAVIAENDDEARIRMLVSENRFDEQQWDRTHRHTEVMQRAIETARHRVVELERLQDELIGRLILTGVTNVADIIER